MAFIDELNEMNQLASEIRQLQILSEKTQVEPDGMEAGVLPVTAAMQNLWQNRIQAKRTRIKNIAAGWV